MKKDSSSKKTTKPTLEGPVRGKKKLCSVKRNRMGSEIDDIFAAKKGKKLEVETNVKNDKPSKALSAKAKPSKRKNAVKGHGRSNVRPDVFEDGASKERKRTEDGLRIFTLKELGIGKPNSGRTRWCPIDCNCCCV